MELSESNEPSASEERWSPETAGRRKNDHHINFLADGCENMEERLLRQFDCCLAIIS